MTAHPLRALALLTGLVLLVAGGLSAAEEPRPVLVLEGWNLEVGARQLVASLQGVSNRTPGAPRVFVLTNPRDGEWLDYSLRLDPHPQQNVSVDELLAAVRPYLKGQVLYNPSQPYTLAVATTAAAIRGAALSATDLGLPTLFDFRAKWASEREAYMWAMQTLLPQSTRGLVALLGPEASAMRDYAIQRRMFTLSTPVGEPSPDYLDVILHFSAGTGFFGEQVDALQPTLDRCGNYLAPAVGAANLSYYATQAGPKQFHQYPGHVEPSAPRYLTLVLDCSDLDFALDDMPGLWADGARGSTPLGWALPGTLAAAAPAVVHRYYADAYRSGTDQFVLGPSGIGRGDLSRATSPEGFQDATAAAADALEAHVALYRVSDAGVTVSNLINQLGARAHLRGVLLETALDMDPAVYDGIPTLAAPRITSLQQASTYLRRIPMDRRFVALSLDARYLGPAEAARLANNAAGRYVVVPPLELMALMLAARQFPAAGEAAIAVTSASFPEGAIAPTASVPVEAVITPTGSVASAALVYRAAGSRFAWAQPLLPSRTGFEAQLPPVLWGGEVEAMVRAVDTNGRVAWSPLWKLQVAREDADGDRLSDAEEAYLLTDPHNPDTDGDGLGDADDPRPLVFDHVSTQYFGPIYPPSDLPYLSNPADSTALDSGRELKPGQNAVYWMPTTDLLPGAKAEIGIEGYGPAQISYGAEVEKLGAAAAADLNGYWYGPVFGAADFPKGVWMRIACPAEASGPLTLTGFGLVSPMEAPSLVGVRLSPIAPGPGQPMEVSATAYQPKGLARVSLTYRINGRGQVTLTMRGPGPQYTGSVPDLENQDRLDYWVTATDAAGNVNVSPLTTLWIGGQSREEVVALAHREFLGDWRACGDWRGAGSLAPAAGVVDTARVNLTGGAYAVWVLGGGRGNGLSVSIDGGRVGALEPAQQDGWQRVGLARLAAGRHVVTVRSEVVNAEAPWAAPRYAAVLLSTDTTQTPPPGQVMDVVNSLSLLSPSLAEPLRGTVAFRATGAGNLAGVEYSLDNGPVHRASGPPFSFSLPTMRYPNGPHVLRLQAVDRTGPTGMTLELPLTIANP
jgi:hypothetical protein